MIHKAYNIDFLVALLDRFYGEENQRQWFHQPQFDVYMRTGVREFHGEGYRTLTIADITVKEEARGQGVMSNVLIDVECAARVMRLDAIFAENVREELVDALSRRGFQEREHSAIMQFNMLKPLI